MVLATLVLGDTFSALYAGEMHGSDIFHAFHGEIGSGVNGNNDHTVTEWDFDGWIGTDEHKLWLKSEGERSGNETEAIEHWVMYSHNIAKFWDLQIGFRHDPQPNSLTHAIIGVDGLAPYFLETEAHLFINEDGDISIRIKQETELLFTQRLITEPYYEVNLYAQDVPELEVGAGIATAEIGLQTRYEITRDFAPYLEIKYERKFGETSSIAKRSNEDNDIIIATAGIRFLF